MAYLLETGGAVMDQGNELGFLLDSVRNVPLLSRDQEWALARRIRRGDDIARELLAISNLKLVISCAKCFQNRGLPIGDLVQIGCLGLMEAVGRFRPNVGRFSTYAVWWIRQAIRLGLQQTSRVIYLPAHVENLLVRAYHVSEGLRQEHGRDPNFDAVTTALKGSASLRNLKAALDSETNSLDTKILPPSLDGREARHADILASPAGNGPLDVIDRSERRAHARELLSKLPARMRFVVIRRFALLGGEPWTLSRIASELQVSRERVRQLEREALQLLRNNSSVSGPPEKSASDVCGRPKRRKKA